MSYATCEAAVLDILRDYSGAWEFTEQNSSRGDYTVKDTYSGGPAVVVRQGGRSLYGDEISPPRRGSQGKEQERHSVYLDLFTPRSDGQGGDEVAYVAAQTLRDALITHYRRYPTLGGACVRCTPITAEVPVFLEKLPHVIQRIALRIDTETAIDLASGEPLR
jgi:hypothetical protein